MIAGEDNDGAANIWSVLHHGSLVAAAVSPVPLPPVTARWTYGRSAGGSRDLGVGGTHYDKATRTIDIGSAQGELDEFEPWPLLHEYGHHLIDVVADPHSPGGDHVFQLTYPDKPALPWEEGFAHAFAAIVLGDPHLTLNCQEGADLATDPAQPLPVHTTEAQYNEIAIAGTLWHLAEYLGAGMPQRGLARIMRALVRAPAHSMREFRDALVKDGSIETTADEHDAIDAAFGNQSIAWGFEVSGDFSDTSQFQPASYYADGEWLEVGFKLVGPAPFGGCPSTPDYPPSAAEPHTGIPISTPGSLSLCRSTRWAGNCWRNSGICRSRSRLLSTRLAARR